MKETLLKGKVTKRLLSVVLVLAMVITLLPMNRTAVYAEENTYIWKEITDSSELVNGQTYVFTSDTYKIGDIVTELSEGAAKMTILSTIGSDGVATNSENYGEHEENLVGSSDADYNILYNDGGKYKLTSKGAGAQAVVGVEERGEGFDYCDEGAIKYIDNEEYIYTDEMINHTASTGWIYSCYYDWCEGFFLSEPMHVYLVKNEEPHIHTDHYGITTATTTDDTLTWYCGEEGCTLEATQENPIKLTLAAANPTYSGEGVTTGWNEGETVAFTLTGEAEWKVVSGNALPEIKYYLENGSITTSDNSGAAGEGQAPVKVGKYVAKITVSDATVTASKEFEIKAASTPGDGGNSDPSTPSGGDSTPSTPSGGDNKPSTPTEDYTIPVESENTVEVKAEIKEGTAKVSEITEETLSKVTDAKGESKVNTIKIDLSGAKQNVTGVTISKKSVETLAKATSDNTNGIDTVTIELSKATVVLDTKTLETLVEDAKGTNIKLVLDDKEHKELNASQQTAVKDYHVATSFEAYFESDGARIHDFKGGKATVSIDFTPEAGKNIAHYHMVYLPDEGGMTRFKTKYENGQLIFTTTHFSDYAVIYDENEKNETGNEEEKLVEQKPTKTQVAANTIAINKGLKVSQTGNKINVSWGKVADADGYLVYAAYCGTDFGKEVKTIKDPSSVSTAITKLNGKTLDSKKNFKVYVKAYKLIDGKKVAFGKSITAHIVGTKNTKYTNVKEIKLTSKSKLALAIGKTSKVKAKTVLVDPAKKQLSDAHAAQFRYASSDKTVATVDKNGKITAKAKGTCDIYVYARNGYAKKVTVSVK